MNVIQELNGCSVFLSHPEYKLFDSENLFLYEDFLNTLTADKDSWITTPKSIAEELNTMDSY